ncbi:hypothetical protein VPH35_093586 [Triticum aestivum]
MAALMAKRSSSERCAIRRELHRCRKLAAAPSGGIVKKLSGQQSSAASIHNASVDEPAGPATSKPPSMPTPRPRAALAMSPASNLQHAPAANKQLAPVAKGDSAAAKEIAASAPQGQVTKRCTAPPRRSALIPTASKMKVSADKVNTGVPSKSTATPPPSRFLELSAKMPSAAALPRSPSIRVKKGMTVKVRTRAGILPTGHCLVLWLAAHYNGNFPRDDPSRTMCDAMHDVRSMPAMAES